MDERIEDIAQAMVDPGKGILAADESHATIGKRFDSINSENSVENRQAYREMLFRSKTAMEDCISGVILFEETLYQNAADGTPFVNLIRDAGAVPGIKVDIGAKPLAGHPGETVTEGLDGLRDKLIKFYEQGARFAKWRGVITIAEELPTLGGIKANAHALARYAALCQETGIVPIVEPEVQLDAGNADSSIERCHEVTSAVLKSVFDELYEQQVILEGMVLKPNMVVSGANASHSADPEEVAAHTVAVLSRNVPAAVPGIAFLSGGQSDLKATANLNAMNANYDLPWAVTFSYGRALQAAALKAWNGSADNIEAGSNAFTHRAKMNSLAAIGEYDEAMA